MLRKARERVTAKRNPMKNARTARETPRRRKGTRRRGARTEEVALLRVAGLGLHDRALAQAAAQHARQHPVLDLPAEKGKGNAPALNFCFGSDQATRLRVHRLIKATVLMSLGS